MKTKLTTYHVTHSFPTRAARNAWLRDNHYESDYSLSETEVEVDAITPTTNHTPLPTELKEEISATLSKEIRGSMGSWRERASAPAFRKTSVLLNLGELAKKLGHSRSDVQAMKKAGFKFSHGRGTLLKPAMDWLADHPDFTTTGYFRSKPSRAA